LVNLNKKVVFTKHLPRQGTPEDDVSPTIAGRVAPTDLTEEEREEIKKGNLGYCESHQLLYKKWALDSCVIPSIFPKNTLCKEWPSE